METVYKQAVDIAPGKYKLNGVKYQTVLSAAIQGNKIAIWFYCDPSHGPAFFDIEVYETGQGFENNIRRKFISTVEKQGYVLHVFEILKA